MDSLSKTPRSAPPIVRKPASTLKPFLQLPSVSTVAAVTTQSPVSVVKVSIAEDAAAVITLSPVLA